MKHSIRYILTMHVLALLAMTLCRVVHLCINLPEGAWDSALALHAMLIGVKFDNLIACYLAAAPVVVLPILEWVVRHRDCFGACMRKAMRITSWYYAVLYAIVLFVLMADVRYYQFFDNHLNIQVTEWFGFAATTAGMLFTDAGNYIYLCLGLVLIGLYEWAVASVSRRLESQPFVPSSAPALRHYLLYPVLLLVLWGACFSGIRGSYQRYPLNVSFAYFCDNTFYNKMGVNALFNIIKSMEYNSSDMPRVLRSVSVTSEDRPQTEVEATEGLHGANVVVVLMESMAAQNLEKTYQGANLTPYLCAMRDSAVYFSNFYSAGIHTNNGIAATLYGYVPNFAHTMMAVPSTLYTGLPVSLREQGYHTHCFVTSNPQYDNMNSFLRDNGFERLHSLYDYDPAAAVNNFGVRDDYMFDYGLKVLDGLAEEKTPFLATFVTVSNHAPFVVPDGFETRGADDDERMIAYADAAVADFMHAAQMRPWASNTVFVLVADHGSPNGGSLYDMTLQYNKIPCYIIAPGMEARVVQSPASQIDIFPTIMGILGYAYTNNTLGIDLLHGQRELAYFVNNDQLGCSDGEYFYCYSINSEKEYLYRLGSPENRADDEPERLNRMKQYAITHMAINLHAIKEQWTAPSR